MSKREHFLPFALPDVDDSEYEQIREALASGWVTTGPKTRQFEAALAGHSHDIIRLEVT